MKDFDRRVFGARAAGWVIAAALVIPAAAADRGASGAKVVFPTEIRTARVRGMPNPATEAEQEPGSRFFPDPAGIPGWTNAGTAEHYERDGLYGYINGGSELYLQYDFRRVDVGRYRKTGSGEAPEITIDVYRMGSDLEAFGIFSLGREPGRRILDLSGYPNWISETQGALAAGSFYVNIIGFETKEDDLALFARAVAAGLQAAGRTAFTPASRPGLWAGLPAEAILADSLRYIQGPLAAQAESELLAADFWNFGAGTTAASAVYGPDRLKLILIDFRTEKSGLMESARNLFAEYLRSVNVDRGTLSAENSAGHVFLFAARGLRAALVFGKKDESAARALLSAALKSPGHAPSKLRVFPRKISWLL